MPLRKFSAPQIFDGLNFAPPGVVLITDANGTIVDLVVESSAGDDIEQVPGILCPGLINAHCHLELSHMKGLIPPGSGLIDFLLTVITKREFPPDVVFEAMSAAESEMFNNGIVAVGDICNTTVSAKLKAASSRIRWKNFIEVLGLRPEQAVDRFEFYQSVQQQFHDLQLDAVLTPHAPYSVSMPLFDLLNDASHHQTLSIHNQEDPAENKLFIDGDGPFLRFFKAIGLEGTPIKPTGTTSLQTVLPHLSHNQQLILVHNVSITSDDISFLEQRYSNKTFLCLCPNANLYIGEHLPPIDRLASCNIPIVIGTDSLGSNDQLSVLSEIQTICTHFPQITIEQALRWATANGAAALGLSDELGSFTKGKKPGVLSLAKDLSSVTRLL